MIYGILGAPELMNKRIKIAIYLLLLLSAGLFVWQFRANYSRLMAEGEPKADTDLINVKLPDYRAKAVPAQTNYHLGEWGAGLVLSIAGLVLLQRIVNEYGETAAADKARKRLTQLEDEGVTLPTVELPAEPAPQASNL